MKVLLVSMVSLLPTDAASEQFNSFSGSSNQKYRKTNKNEEREYLQRKIEINGKKIKLISNTNLEFKLLFGNLVFL